MSESAQQAPANGTGNGSGPSGSGWLKLVLIGSLALNLLVAGGALGSWWTHGRHGGPFGNRMLGVPRGGEEVGIAGFARQLPAERRQVIRKILRETKPDFAPLREEVRNARKAAAEVLASDPFDATKVRDAFAAIDAAEARLRSAARESVIKAAESMAPEERRALSAWWQERRPGLFRERGPQGGGERRHKRDGPRDAPPGGPGGMGTDTGPDDGAADGPGGGQPGPLNEAP